MVRKQDTAQETENGLSRRSFLVGGAAAALAAAGTMMVGCSSPANSDPQSGSESSNTAAVAQTAADEHIGAGRRATATLENAEPIEPLAPPANWDSEVDIVIVGAGGGGIAGALVAREMGASVIVVEKSAESGGATAHANGWLNVAGTAKAQQDIEFAYPEFPYDRTKFIAAMQNVYQYSIDNSLLAKLAEKGGECADWITDKGTDWMCIGPFFVHSAGMASAVLGQKVMTDQFEKLGTEAGAEYRFNCECTGLVVENNRVVGIRAREGSSDVYLKADKGVVLCAGGFGMNPDLLKKYSPTAYESIVYGGPFPSHSGEALRMALGAGADISGFDSWSCWESAPDNGTGDWNYFYGIRQFLQMPWLNFDCEGKRCDFYDSRLPNMPAFVGSSGDTLRVAAQMSRPNGRVYCIFDSNYEEYAAKIAVEKGERMPAVASAPDRDPGLYDSDWHVEFQNALGDGRIKKADTLEELAEMLDLDPVIVKDTVERWNANCEKGVDDDPDLIYPYLPEWLNPIEEGPFYGAALGGQLGKTMAGVRVNDKLQAMDAHGHEIPGLYAGFTTAGGAVGESNFGGGLINTSLLGGCALSWVSGYYAVQSALSA